ncbi:MAG: preprotein translocase subunit SecG [Gammaproteobacteria bacterium]|jgi:preprotein translocase subunit SecG
MYEGVLVVHVILAALLIGLVLLQQGKGGGMGTAFGSGAETLLSTPGASNILSRSTGIIATLFFVTSLSLGYLASQKSRSMNEALIPAAISEPDTVLMTVPESAPAENINQGTEKPQIP